MYQAIANNFLTNTLVFYITELITAAKSFVIKALRAKSSSLFVRSLTEKEAMFYTAGPNVIKLFYDRNLRMMVNYKYLPPVGLSSLASCLQVLP